MKYIVFLMLVASLVLSSCIDELPELEFNPLEDETQTFLEITDHTYNRGLGRVTLNFDVRYDFGNNRGIKGISVIKNRGQDFLITDPEQRIYSEIIGLPLPASGTACYQLAFFTSTNLNIRKTSELCIEL